MKTIDIGRLESQELGQVVGPGGRCRVDVVEDFWIFVWTFQICGSGDGDCENKCL